METRLINIDEPLLRIPNLAIHLDRTINEGFKFNLETQLIPILSNSASEDAISSGLYELLRSRLGLSRDDGIIETELCLYDTQGPVLSGLHKEFLHSARLDNLLMSYTATMSLILSEDIDNENGVRMVCLFDHEEVGSQTSVGADSNFLHEVLERLLRIGKVWPPRYAEVFL